MSVSPILIEFPEEFQTQRLVIGAPRWGAGPAVNEAIQESIHELKPWLPFAQAVPTIEESEAHVRKARLQFFERKDLVLHLLDKNTGSFVGSSGLHRIDWQVRKFEIGYWLRTSRTGEGLALEAVHGITSFAIRELQANRIEIRCDARNDRSARVAAKAGFKLEGILRKNSLDMEGNVADTIVFSKVRGLEFG